MARKINIDKESCLSCWHCVESVPEAFRISDDILAEAFDSYSAPEEKIQEVIDSCLVHCIHWD
jgi:ferredoxin